MSRSFRFFRKHTKVMMASLVLLCLGLFVFSSSFGGNSGRDDGARDGQALVATWNGGQLNQAELASLVQQRVILNEVLQRLFIGGGGDPTGYNFPQHRIPAFFLRSNRADYVEQLVVETEVYADLAQKAGFTVSDRRINDYLQEVGLKNVDTAGIQAILAGVGQNGARVNEAIVFSTLRKLLLAYYYQQGYDSIGLVVLPQQRWDDWRKVHERISLQAAKLPVDSFVKDVAEPTDSQIAAIYEEFKEYEPNQQVQAMGQVLDSPTPGFRQPRRVRLQFVLASVAERAEKLADTVTEAEIADYYERNKRTEFVKSDLFGEDDEAADADTGAEGEAAGDDAASTDDSSEDAAAGEATQPPSDAPATDGKAPAEGDSSAAPQRSPFRLAALQAAPAADSAEAETQSDASGTEPAGADEEAEAGADDADDEPPVEYEPLDKVRDEIRTTLATDKAIEELSRTMGEAAAQLQTEFNRFASAVAEARELKKKLPEPPARLADFQWLADSRGLTFEKTASLTARELAETAVGKAADEQNRRSVLEAAFTTLELFEPLLARDLNGDWYLVSKIEDVPSRVPPLDEIESQVIQAWKLREAANLAEKKAQEMAAEFEKSDVPFDAFFGNRGFDVVDQTAMFSWRYYPAANPGQGSPILSAIPELPSIGPDFMEAVFKLDGNRTIGLLNFDKSAAYVVRLNARQYTPDELKKFFLEEVNSWPGQVDMRQEHFYDLMNAARQELLIERGGLVYDPEWLARRQEQLVERQE